MIKLSNIKQYINGYTFVEDIAIGETLYKIFKQKNTFQILVVVNDYIEERVSTKNYQTWLSKQTAGRV